MEIFKAVETTTGQVDVNASTRPEQFVYFKEVGLIPLSNPENIKLLQTYLDDPKLAQFGVNQLPYTLSDYHYKNKDYNEDTSYALYNVDDVNQCKVVDLLTLQDINEDESPITYINRIVEESKLEEADNPQLLNQFLISAKEHRVRTLSKLFGLEALSFFDVDNLCCLDIYIEHNVLCAKSGTYNPESEPLYFNDYTFQQYDYDERGHAIDRDTLGTAKYNDVQLTINLQQILAKMSKDLLNCFLTERVHQENKTDLPMLYAPDVNKRIQYDYLTKFLDLKLILTTRPAHAHIDELNMSVENEVHVLREFISMNDIFETLINFNVVELYPFKS